MKVISASKTIKEKIDAIIFGHLEVKKVTILENDTGFDAELPKLENEIQQKFSLKPPSEDAVVSATRKLYRLAGWEPTKYRPSSEALIRRILQHKSLYRINNLVDYGNLVSARFHIPLGLYDLDKIQGEMVLDMGKEGETYQGISRPVITAAGKIILRDEVGVFGNPTADSFRTAISNRTNNACAVFFIYKDIDLKYITKMLKELEMYYSAFSEEKIITKIYTA
jgi:DNA/RNA-binding domain of Phe-tRNA-synthetase-like protein